MPSQRPRSPRVPVEFALEVAGTTAAGSPFNVQAHAIKISRGGATIILDAGGSDRSNRQIDSTLSGASLKRKSTEPGPIRLMVEGGLVLSYSKPTAGLRNNFGEII